MLACNSVNSPDSAKRQTLLPGSCWQVVALSALLSLPPNVDGDEPTLTLTREIVDGMAFGNVIVIDAVGAQQFARQVNNSAESVRGKMDAELKRELGRLAEACSLTENQQRKLQLAGRGD